MDHIDNVLMTAALNNVKFSAPIHAALAIAKDTLNVYYDHIDESKVYRIAISTFFPSFLIVFFNI